jgi:hypothetical protein
MTETNLHPEQAHAPPAAVGARDFACSGSLLEVVRAIRRSAVVATDEARCQAKGSGTRIEVAA